LKKFAGSLAATVGWRKVREDIEVKLARSADTGETIVLCRSADRRNKERAMHDKFSQRNFWTGSASPCPSASASPNTSCRRSLQAPKH